MLIAQISDIHVGPDFRDEVFHRAADEVSKLDPDLLLITGDLTENGLLSEYQRAAELMEQFPCRSKIFASGNHDYRNTGYLLFRQFFPAKPVFRSKDTFVATLSTARPERNEGEAGHRQIVWLETALRREKKRFKLVIMHHHLVPVPDTGPNTIPILDAGDVLRSLDRSGVGLVLCGHRHRPWKWSLNRIPIIHAGSLSSQRLRGFFANSYNIIETSPDGYRAWLKIVNGPRLSFPRILEGETGLATIPFLNRFE